MEMTFSEECLELTFHHNFAVKTLTEAPSVCMIDWEPIRVARSEISFTTLLFEATHFSRRGLIARGGVSKHDGN